MSAVQSLIVATSGNPDIIPGAKVVVMLRLCVLNWAKVKFVTANVNFTCEEECVISCVEL